MGNLGAGFSCFVQYRRVIAEAPQLPASGLERGISPQSSKNNDFVAFRGGKPSAPTAPEKSFLRPGKRVPEAALLISCLS